MRATTSVGMALAAALLATPALGAPVTWNTCGTSLESCAHVTSPASKTTIDSNTLKFTSNGEVLFAHAYRTTNNTPPYGNAKKTSITLWGGGIGAGGEAPSPEHGVDNNNPDEFILFMFPNDNFIPRSFMLGFVENDADVITYIGGAGTGFFTSLESGTFNWDSFIADPGAQGFVSELFGGNNKSVPVGVPQFFTNDASGRYLIIGARNEEGLPRCLAPCYDGRDYFKIEQITAKVAVPEPATALLLATGLAGVLTARFRHRR